MKRQRKQVDVEGVKRLKENGYNPIHIFGSLYLVRHTSKNYSRLSYYRPKRYIKP